MWPSREIIHAGRFPNPSFQLVAARENVRNYFPIRLTDSATLKKWECLDSATGEASAFFGFRRDKLAAAVRKHHLPDFL